MLSIFSALSLKYKVKFIIYWPFILFNFSTWYKVITWTGNAFWPVSLIGHVTSTWSHDFISKRFLVHTLFITHVIKVLMMSIVCSYQGLLLVRISTPFLMWRLRFYGVCTSLSLYTMYVDKANVRRVNTWLKFLKVIKRGLKVELNWFLRITFHKWISSKSSLIPQIFFQQSFLFFYL